MPNTKTKKFDFQIFLAVSLILLVICCATVCVVLSNNETGVAHADTIDYTFTATERVYVKNYTSATSDEIEKVINYYLGFLAGLYDINTAIDYSYYGGTVSISYNTTSSGVKTVTAPIQYKITQQNFEGTGLITFLLNIGSKDFNILGFFYDFTSKSLLGYSTFTPIVDTETGNYYIDCTPSAQDNNYFPYFLMQDLLGSGNDATTINSMTFNYNAEINLRCFLSNTDTYYTPVAPGSGGYDEGYQTGYDVGYEDGRVAGIEEANTSYSDGYKAALDSVKSINLTSNLEYFNRYSYQYLDNDLWKQAQTTQINSQVWLNNTTSDYLFTTKYFNLSNLNSLIAQRQYKNFTLYASERHQGGSSLSFTIAVESLNESFSISFYDGSRLTYTLELSNTYQNGLPVSYGTLPIGYPFTHIVLNYIDSHALFTLDAVNQIVITANNFVVDSYNTALEQGFNNGYQQGYSTALELYANNDYSFFSLFTSVFDAPITAIVGKWGDSDGDGVYQREGGMLNFYIPGLDINFAPFLLSLFTIGIIVLIIRFILARKS